MSSRPLLVGTALCVVLTVAAAFLLVVGLSTADLTPVYVSIAVSVVVLPAFVYGVALVVRALAPVGDAVTKEQPALKDKLAALRTDAEKKRLRRRGKGKRWKQANYIIGGLSVVLGVVAGAAVFADLAEAEASTEWQIAVGIVALASGLLGALVGFYDFGTRTVRVLHEEGAWLRLEGQIDIALSKWERVNDDEKESLYDECIKAVSEQQQEDAAARKRP